MSLYELTYLLKQEIARRINTTIDIVTDSKIT